MYEWKTTTTYGPREMNADADLLSDLLSEAPRCLDGFPLTTKAISNWTGLALQTISNYKLGVIKNIPVHFWKAIYRHLPDQRIADLILDGLCDVIRRDTLPDLTDAPAAFETLHAMSSKWHNMQKRAADILCDGKIDHSDEEFIRDYKRASRELFAQNLAFIRSLDDTLASSKQGGRS